MSTQQIATDTNPSPDIIDSPRVVCERTTLSPTTIWRLRRAGLFPEPIALSPGRKGFRRREIDAWLATREGGQ